MIECALHGADQFMPDCQVERGEFEGARYLVVRHPDGGFRRFEVLTDGRGLATADGAEELRAEVANGQLAVAIGSDRYRFPATIKDGDDAPAAVE